MNELGMYHGASTIMRKTLDWNRSRFSMLEVEAEGQIKRPITRNVPHTDTLFRNAFSYLNLILICEILD
jgi:hypothetical protein